MTEDPIIEEVRRIRREIEVECDNDWEKLFQYFLQVQKDSSHQVVSRSPKPLPKVLPKG